MDSIRSSRSGKVLSFCLLACLMLLPCAFAQETTAGLQGNVKDSSGGVVAKAKVEVTSPALIGNKTTETDTAGYFHFANLPPGTYTVTVTATGFRTFKESVELLVGHLPTLEITLAVGTVTETVEVSEQATIVDATQSKVQTNITAQELMNVPTQTRSFQSVIQFAPGARSEPLQSNSAANNALNGYQIDGASNSENSYLVEGLETASIGYGNSAVNVPMDFIQEVQVKSSGFEAEYGGALGGVVNVVGKRGGNEWHGTAFVYYRGDGADAAPNPTNIKNPAIPAVGRIDQPVEDYQPKKDHYRTTDPGFTLGGPIMKDRLWLFLGAAPDFQSTARTVNMLPSSGAAGPRTYTRNINTYYTNARLDYLLTQKIRLFGAWTYGYSRSFGTSLPGADDVFGGSNSSAGTNPDNFNYGIGNVQPNVVYNVGADVSITPNLIATTRYGYFYQDYQDRGLPVGIQYTYRDTNYPYSTGNAPALAGTTALNGTPLQADLQHPTGYANIGTNNLTAFDRWARYSFNQDLAYFKHGFGTHNFKFGYALTHGTNNVLSGYNTADIYVGYNIKYSPVTSNGQANCAAIVAQNQSLYGAPGGAANGANCQGLWGTVNLRDFGTTGKVGGWNHGFYVQDAWTVARRLTLNLGVRLEKETLPSYNTLPGFKGLDFGWGDKVAPRVGAAYDLFGNSKVKIYGSFGYFYDLMKYNLPRGSFGGDYWHDCVYALDIPDYRQIIPSRDAQGHYCPLGGGSAKAVGNLPAGMRFIENLDYREPSNDPNQIGSLGPTGLVDPNLKPLKQHEMVVGADWALTPSLALETRYSRKRLDRTIEDAGTITQDGEVYYITNPGEGVNAVVPNCNGCPPNPKPSRRYDGVEFRLTKRAGRAIGSLSYTYSRLYGNYTGLTATDTSDAVGRNGADVDRAFDEPYMSFDSHGHPIDGPLPTDRPHTFKAYGFYNLRWHVLNLQLGGFEQIYSGTPLSSYLSVSGAPVFIEGRGEYANVTRDATGNFVLGNVTARRTPMFSQTDISVAQDFHVSKSNEKLIARFAADCFNCLNQHSPTIYNTNLYRTGTITAAKCGTAGTNCTPTEAAQAGFDYGAIMTKGFDYIGLTNTSGLTLNSLYGQPTSWQLRRSMRFGVTFTF